MESLEKIKDAENRAAMIIEHANLEKAKIIADARKKAVHFMEQVRERSEEKRERLLADLDKELEEEKQEKLIVAKEHIKKLKADSTRKISKEVDYLYEKFLEAIK